MKFIFSWKKDLTHCLCSLEKYFFHSKINFICSRHRVISSIYLISFLPQGAVVLCSLLNAKVLAFYSNCPKVSVAVPSNAFAPDGKLRKCSGTLLRASRIVRNAPMAPDAGGQKDYSSKSGRCNLQFDGMNEI